MAIGDRLTKIIIVVSMLEAEKIVTSINTASILYGASFSIGQTGKLVVLAIIIYFTLAGLY